MAKQQLVNKRVLGVTGVLFLDEETNKYKVQVETKESVSVYDLEDDFLKEMIGEVITLGSETDTLHN